MVNNFKETTHAQINESLNKTVDVLTPKIKKADYKLMTFWVIVGLLTLILFYYAYEMLYIYFILQ